MGFLFYSRTILQQMTLQRTHLQRNDLCKEGFKYDPSQFLSFICIVNATTSKDTTTNFPAQLRNLGIRDGWFVALQWTARSGVTTTLLRRNQGTLCESPTGNASDSTDYRTTFRSSPVAMLQESPNLYATCCNASAGATADKYVMMTWWCNFNWRLMTSSWPSTTAMARWGNSSEEYSVKEPRTKQVYFA